MMPLSLRWFKVKPQGKHVFHRVFHEILEFCGTLVIQCDSMKLIIQSEQGQESCICARFRPETK